MKKIAVIGAGYAGLALSWHLLQKGRFSVTVFDEGKGASHVSTGLLHATPGRKPMQAWRAQEGMQAALELLEVASGRCKVYEKTGLIRIAVTEEQRKDFGQEILWTPEAYVVFCPLYLQELKNACSSALFVETRIAQLSELSDFDLVVLTAGAGTLLFHPFPLRKTIGQALLCKTPHPLPISILSHGQITATQDPSYCLVGSTYEHTEFADPQKGWQLLEQAAFVCPFVRDFRPVEARTAVRVSPLVGYRPLAYRFNERTWVFTGLGSRGLLYHALFAKELADEIEVANSESLFV